MQKKFFGGLVLVLVLNLLIKPFYILGIDASVQNRLGEEVYGNYFALLNFSFLLNILNDLGLSNYYTRLLAKETPGKNPDFIGVFILRLLLFVVYFLVTMGLAVGFKFNDNELMILLVLVFNQFLVAGIQYCRATFSGLLYFKTDAIISVMDRVLLIGLASYLIWGIEQFDIWDFVIAQSIAYGVTLFISLILVMPKIKVGMTNWSIKESLQVLRKAWPFSLLVLLMMLYSRTDAIMIERLLPNGDYHAGLYAQGFRFLDAANMFALLIAGLLLPTFSRLLENRLELIKMINISTRLLLGIGIVGALIGYYQSGNILAWRYGSSTTTTSIMSFSLLMISFLWMCFTYLYGTLLTANGSLKALNIMAFSSLVCNIVLNYIFILKWQEAGAALATLITQMIAGLIQFILAVKVFKLEFKYRLFLRLIVFAVGSYATIFLIHEFSIISFQLEIILELICIALLAFGIRLVEIKPLLALLKSKEN